MKDHNVFSLASLVLVVFLWMGTSTDCLAIAQAADSTAPSSAEEVEEVSLASLTNYQTNNHFMVSSGLPSAAHFALLKAQGVGVVIDLIPNDRSQEQQLVNSLSLDYLNIPVDWEKPTLANFLDYTNLMAAVERKNEKVLTHCKLNWRGAVFTYLYRITQLGEPETVPKQDLLAIWQPNPTWFAFMNKVIDDFNRKNNTTIITTVTPQIAKPSGE